MTPDQAAKILDVDPQASPEMLERRFQEVRARLEEKIGKAPTPGLKEKYRATLEETTKAFEMLTLAADATLLPMAQRAEPAERKSAPGESRPQVVREAVTPTRPAGKVKGSGKEFIVVAIIAIVLLGGGGWWVMKSRAEAAEAAKVAVENTRLAEEARIKREQEAAAAAALREQGLTQLRSRLAELNVAHEALNRLESTAERELSELRSAEREAVREAKGNLTPAARQLSVRVRALDRYVVWLRESLANHPARTARARADELLKAKALEESQEAVVAFANGLQQLKTEIAEARAATVVVGEVRVESNLPETSWKLTDSFGMEFSGAGPAIVSEAGLGRASVVFSAPRWPDVKQSVEVVRGKPVTVRGEFVPATLMVKTPEGARVTVAGLKPEVDGTWKLEPGLHLLEAELPGFAPKLIRLSATAGARLEHTLQFDQDYLSPSLEIWMHRVNEIQDGAAFLESASALLGNLRKRGDTAAMREVARIIPQRSYVRMNSTVWSGSLFFHVGAAGLQDETRALISTVDGLLAANKLVFNYGSVDEVMIWQGKISALSLLRDMDAADAVLAELVKIRIKGGNESSAEGRRELMTSIARGFATYGFYQEAREWAGRARSAGAKDADVQNVLANADIAEAIRQRQVGKYIGALKQIVQSELAKSAQYQPGKPPQVSAWTVYFPMWSAYRAGADNLLDEAVAYLKEVERSGGLNIPSESMKASLAELADPQLRAEKRNKFVKEQERILREARIKPEATEALKPLVNLVEDLVQAPAR